MLLTNLARNYRNLNPEQYNCEMNGGSKSNQFTCHLAVPSAVCSSRRSSAAVGPPPVTPAASGSPPLLSCTHILYTDSILRRHQKPRGIHQHQIRENATQPEMGKIKGATHRSADSWTSSAARKKGSFSQRSNDVAIPACRIGTESLARLLSREKERDRIQDFQLVGGWRGGGTARAWLSLLFRPLLLAAISFLVPGWWLCLLLRRASPGAVGWRAAGAWERRGRACAAVLGTWLFRCRVGCHTRLLPSDYQVKIILSSCCHRKCVCILLSSQLFEAGLLLLSSPVYPFLISRWGMFIHTLVMVSDAGWRLLSDAGRGGRLVAAASPRVDGFNYGGLALPFCCCLPRR